MYDIMLFWSAMFKSVHPQNKVIVLEGGSSAAILALLDGTANLGLMSRKWRSLATGS